MSLYSMAARVECEEIREVLRTVQTRDKGRVGHAGRYAAAMGDLMPAINALLSRQATVATTVQ